MSNLVGDISHPNQGFLVLFLHGAVIKNIRYEKILRIPTWVMNLALIEEHICSRNISEMYFAYGWLNKNVYQ